MKKKMLAMLLSAAMVVGLCACGEATTPVEPVTEEPTEEAQATEVIEQLPTSPMDALYNDETINLVVWGAEEDQAMLQEMIDAFQTEYSKQKFNISLGVQSESTAKDTVLTDPEAAADVFAFADDQLNELVNAGALQEVATNFTFDVANENNAGAVAAASKDGKLYAYPMTADNGYFMFYDKSYFSEEDVKSMDKMLEIAAGKGKYVYMCMSEGAWYTYSFFQAAGLSVGLNDDGLTNNCNWNTTEGQYTGVDVAEAMLAITASDGYIDCSDGEFATGVQEGKIIAGVSGTWNAGTAEETWGENYAAVKLPTFTLADDQVQMSSFAGYKLIGVNAFSQNPAWSMALAEWLTNENNQIKRFSDRNLGLSNIAAATSAEVQAAPAIAALAEQSAYATVQRVGGNYWEPVNTFGAIIANGNPEGTDLQELLDNMVAGITGPVQ